MKKSGVADQKSLMMLTAPGSKLWIKEFRSHGNGRFLNKVTLRQIQTNKHVLALLGKYEKYEKILFVDKTLLHLVFL